VVKGAYLDLSIRSSLLLFLLLIEDHHGRLNYPLITQVYNFFCLTMHNPSALATNQEPGPAFDLVAQLGGFTFNKAVQSINSCGFSLGKSNSLFFDSPIGQKTRKVKASLSLSSRSGFKSVSAGLLGFTVRESQSGLLRFRG